MATSGRRRMAREKHSTASRWSPALNALWPRVNRSCASSAFRSRGMAFRLRESGVGYRPRTRQRVDRLSYRTDGPRPNPSAEDTVQTFQIPAPKSYRGRAEFSRDGRFLGVGEVPYVLLDVTSGEVLTTQLTSAHGYRLVRDG